MTPTLRDLAEEMAARREECGLVEDECICVRKKGHDELHQFVPMSRVIPIS